MLPRLVLLGALAMLLFPRVAWASDEVSTRHVAILMRALAYDRDLKARAGDSVTIAVVYKPGTPDADRVISTFKEIERLTLQGLPVRVVSLPVSADLSAKLRGEKASALYLVAGLDDSLDAVLAASRQNQAVTMATRRSYVERGASVGVVMAGGRPKLVVNLKASRAEGAKFGSDLLAVATVLR